MRTALGPFTLALVSFAATVWPRAAVACNPVFDSYYKAVTTDPAHPNQCDWTDTDHDGRADTCHIDLKGILYEASGPNPPVILWNHGSGKRVGAGAGETACTIADYLVPLGYTVYVPIRRGHYAPFGSSLYRSTGVYILDNYSGPARIDELKRQRFDVARAAQHVKGFNGSLRTSLALMGNSYGAMVSIFTNTMFLEQTATVPFSAGGDSWIGTNGQPNTYLQDQLEQAVVNSLSAMFFLQARWDHDTRPTSELSHALANAGLDPENGREYQAAIFGFGYPDDPQLTHVEFPKQTALWGPSVLAFLERYDVKP